MRISRRAILPLPLVALVFAGATLSACRSAGIARVYTARDAAGRRRTSTFRPDDEVHILIEWVAGRDDAVLTLGLFPPANTKPEPYLSEVDMTPGKGSQTIDIQLLINIAGDDGKPKESKVGPWPTGKYEVDLKIDDSFEETVKFSVGD